MIFDKNIFLSNLQFLMAEKNIKPKDLESASGVSKGYISRLSKEGNPSIPGIDFLLTAAEMFDVSLESLVGGNYALASDNDVYFTSFIDKLISKTEKREIIWSKASFAELSDASHNKRLQNTLVKDTLAALAAAASSSLQCKAFSSAFDYGNYHCVDYINYFLLAPLNENYEICIVKVILKDDAENEATGIEVYMLSKDDHKLQSKICNTYPAVAHTYDQNLSRLYNIADRSIHEFILDNQTREVLDAFMKS